MICLFVLSVLYDTLVLVFTSSSTLLIFQQIYALDYQSLVDFFALHHR